MSPGHGLVCPKVTAATSLRLLDDHLGRSYHKRRLRLWRRCSGEVEKRQQVERPRQRGGGRGCDGWKQSAREGTAEDERE